MKTIVIKSERRRLPEKFSEKKLVKSIEKTCLALRLPEGIAEDTSKIVLMNMRIWLNNKPEITSRDIRLKTADFIAEFNPEIAHFYKNYRKTL